MLIPEWRNENQCKSILAGDSHSNPAGNGFGRCSRQSIPDATLGGRDAAVLLPLRLRVWHETLHEDVRTAAIPKPLVGHLLPQEELDC